MYPPTEMCDTEEEEEEDARFDFALDECPLGTHSLFRMNFMPLLTLIELSVCCMLVLMDLRDTNAF